MSKLDKPWTVNRIIGELNQWDCHQGESECPHRYCDTLCSGKVADQCEAEAASDSLEDANADIPGCHPESCGQAQLEALLVVAQAMLNVPGARDAAEEALRKWMGEE